MPKKAHRELSDRVGEMNNCYQVAELLEWAALMIEQGELSASGLRLAATNAKIAASRASELKAATLREQARLDVARLTQYS